MVIRAAPLWARGGGVRGHDPSAHPPPADSPPGRPETAPSNAAAATCHNTRSPAAAKPPADSMTKRGRASAGRGRTREGGRRDEGQAVDRHEGQDRLGHCCAWPRQWRPQGPRSVSGRGRPSASAICPPVSGACLCRIGRAGPHGSPRAARPRNAPHSPASSSPREAARGGRDRTSRSLKTVSRTAKNSAIASAAGQRDQGRGGDSGHR